MKEIVSIDKEKCTGCGLCARICPTKILKVENKSCTVTDHSKCDRLRGCQFVCPTGAIKIN
jgi:NAD-dependent dihydropyrimidine dehydrogenase PreA subunit